MVSLLVVVDALATYLLAQHANAGTLAGVAEPPDILPVLAVRALAGFVCFWVAIFTVERAYHLRRSHVTPPPQFGRGE